MDRQANFNSLMQRIDQRKQAMSSYYANRAKSRGLLDQAGQGPLSGMDTGSGIGHMPPPRPSFGGRETMDLRPGDGGWHSPGIRQPYRRRATLELRPGEGAMDSPGGWQTLPGRPDMLDNPSIVQLHQAQVSGGTPLASHVGGMLGVALTAGGPASAGPPGVAPYQLQRGRKIYSGPRDIKPNMLQDSYYEPLRRGIDRLAAPIVPNYSPLAKQPPAQGPSPTSPFGIGQPQGASAAPNQPQIGLPGSPPPQSLPAPGLGMLPQGPFPQAGALGQGGLHSGATFPDPNYVDDITPQDAERAYGFQQGRQRLLDRQAEGQSRWQGFFQDQDEQNRQTGLANLRPNHFGGPYGGDSLGGATNRNRAQADAVLGGGAAQGHGASVSDPRFASMDRFLKPQTVDINPFKDNVREQSWKDMDSRNGYGLNRDKNNGMNMQTRLSPEDAGSVYGGAEGGGIEIGTYGNSTLYRINGKNVLVGNKSPSKEALEDGTITSNQAAQDGVRRHTDNYLSGKTPQWGVNPNSPNLNSTVLAANRQKFLEGKAQKATQKQRGLGVPQSGGYGQPQASVPPGAPIPVDKAVAGLQRHDPGPWQIVGIDDLTKAKPGAIVKSLNSSMFQRMSPERQKAMRQDIENWYASLDKPTEDDEEVLATARGDKKMLEKIKGSRKKAWDDAWKDSGRSGGMH